MRSNLIILTVLLAAATAQHHRLTDSRNAKILQEARYLQGGNHGSAYVQDDGTEFKEETDSDGNRRGSYSYIDDTGKKLMVNYIAGKMGFVVSGDHIPTAPPPPAQPQAAAYQPNYNSRRLDSASQYNSAPQYNTIPAQTSLHHYQGQDYNSNTLTPNHYQGQGHFDQTNYDTPQSAQRYYPQGKINLNRTPDGFQYSFSSQ